MKKKNVFLLIFTLFLTVSLLVLPENNRVKAETTNITATVYLSGGTYGEQTSYQITGKKGSKTLLGIPQKQGYILSGYQYSYGKVELVPGGSYLYTFGDQNETIIAIWERFDSSDLPVEPTAPPVVPTLKPTEVPKPRFSVRCNQNKIKSNGSNAHIATNKKIKFYISKKNVKSVKYKILSNGSKSGWKTLKGNLEINRTIKRGRVYFQYIDLLGKRTTVKTSRFTLDKSKPSINGVRNNTSYKHAVIVQYKDLISGIGQAKLNGKKISSGKWISANGYYKLTVRDKVGNTNTVQFSIQKPTPKPVVATAPKNSTKTSTTKKKITKKKTTNKKTTKKKTTKKKTTKKKTTSSNNKKGNSILLSKNSLELSVGKSKRITANQKVIWKSQQPFVATVSKDGRVLAKSKGYTTIVAVSTKNKKITAQCKIFVR